MEKTPPQQPPLYPQLQDPHEPTASASVPADTAGDEEMARRLQAQYDRGEVMAVAQPVQQTQLPYKCGSCGTTHVVRNVTHGATFQCTVCGAQNQILLQDRRPVAVVQDRSYSFLPIPVFCSVM